MEVSLADFYALREFLDREYREHPDFRKVNNELTGTRETIKEIKQMFGSGSYAFTYINPNLNGFDFHLRKSKMIVNFYDLVTFNYKNGNITIENGKQKDENDNEKVSGLINLLNSKVYGQLISNLDDLKMNNS